ncbi:MAG: hypothetical protein AAF492_04145 [Verrucomicrobiota bacterium]
MLSLIAVGLFSKSKPASAIAHLIEVAVHVPDEARNVVIGTSAMDVVDRGTRYSVRGLSGSASVLKPSPRNDILYYDGKDLTGQEGANEFWSVKDDVILGHSDQQITGNQFLWSHASQPAFRHSGSV